MQCIFSRNTFNVFYSTLEVMVSLSESNHQLILQIQDNGIGFDPATVEQGLHVGFHSMCTRISRIGGQFEIDSEPGHTTIQVILPLTESKQMTAMDSVCLLHESMHHYSMSALIFFNSSDKSIFLIFNKTCQKL